MVRYSYGMHWVLALLAFNKTIVNKALIDTNAPLESLNQYKVMSISKKTTDISNPSKMSRSSFLNTLGAVGILGTVPFLASACQETDTKPVIYEGEGQDAIIDNIITRRSVRKYTNQEIPQDLLDTIMKCAIFAPSAVNAQPWEVRVIQNPEILKEIARRHIDYLRSHDKKLPDTKDYSVTYHAPILIIIAKAVKETGTLSTLLDTGIILQNILLSAHALNLGTCTMAGIVPFLNEKSNSDLLQLFNIPDDYEVGITAALGYPDEIPTAPIRHAYKIKYIR